MFKDLSMKDKEDSTTSHSTNQTKNAVSSKDKGAEKKDSTSSQFRNAESISKAKEHFDDERVISEEELKIQFLPPLLPSKGVPCLFLEKLSRSGQIIN